MSEPSNAELLKAITDLGVKISAVDAKVDAHRAETAKAFAHLDRELARLHRELGGLAMR
jgi:hypothetical protein